jgi:hypothetical protein
MQLNKTLARGFPLNNKTILASLTTAMLLIGVAFILVPFIGSLKPSARTEAMLSRINLLQIKNNSFEIRKHPIYGDYKTHDGYNYAVVIYKKFNSEVKLWDVPIKNNAVGMPDMHWWKPMYDCKNFSPSIDNGTINEYKAIKCHDFDKPKWWKDKWIWSLEGKSLDGLSGDMIKTKGVISGNYFVFQKSS